ncbi:P44/Msp2 family outer membrane protein [Anaplasma ovis str. Haibei]|uniref:P44/Msp2 family outer membrane protein n=1 Tax=Anaplasma ovis str. Haibei TaxID=1248439 RepID=A0A2Z2LFV9_9RICK|nr:P44/Msp2 family outer membrane protein [Anaplasma ovis]ASI48313.1 P44/Msp2 family outer membrane protein [Anaplasma ovis str. Haibei]
MGVVFVNYARSFLAGTVALSAVCLNFALPSVALAYTSDWEQQGGLYAGLTLNPSYGSVQNFKLKDSGQNPAGILTYYSGLGTVSERFDWDILDSTVEFENSSFPALEGAVGLNMQNFRVELNVGREVFPVKTDEVGNSRTFLVIRDLAHAIAQRDSHAIESALFLHTGGDIQKIKSAISGIEEIELALKAGVEQRFVDMMRSMQKNPKAEFPRSAVRHLVAGRGAEKYKYSPELVAKKIAGLSTQGVARVASSFVRNVEGATVARISDITSTSVTLNVCRDVPTYVPGARLIPYACAGVGWGFMGMSGETATHLVYKVKGGARYALTPRVHLIAGAFLQGVFGNVKHHDIDTDSVAGGISKSASRISSTFRLKNLGLNIGASFSI